MKSIHQNTARLLALCVVLCASVNAVQAKKNIEHRHSITPMLGLANNATTPFSISPNPMLKIDYVNGDNMRIPVSLRYQYRMSHGNRLGIDFLGNNNPMYVKPSFYTKDIGFVGPSVINHKGTMLGADIHYSKTIDIKLIEVFGFLGIGGYFQASDNTLTADYTWYKNAAPEFYEFAVAASNNTVKRFMPITTFGFGARFKHLEGGLNYQYSLVSPVNAFEYQGIRFNNNMRFRSVGYYLAYRFEF